MSSAVEQANTVLILLLTLNDSDEVVRTVLNAGARGFLLKSDATRDLIAAVDALQHNRTFFTRRVSQMILDGYLAKAHGSSNEGLASETLTPREREIRAAPRRRYVLERSSLSP